MATLTLFRSHAPTMGYVFRSGRSVHFTEGKFATSNQDEIDELTKECQAGHPNYYIDDGQKTIDSEALDPMAIIRARIREEERAKLLAATNPARDLGETEQGKLEGIANSASILGLQVQSDAQGQAANPTVARTITPAAPTAKATKL